MSSSRRSSISSRPQPVTLLDEIDEWERGTLILVKQTADRARQRVTELMMSNNIAAGRGSDSNDVSKDIQRRRSVDSSIEQDIERLNAKLKHVQTDLNTRSPRVRMNVTPIDWSSVLRIFVDTANYNFPQQKQLFFGGTLLTQEQQVQLNEFYGNPNQTWHLIYKATRDGFNIADFHRCCDNKGPTLTIIQASDRYLFGGYTAADWNSYDKTKRTVVDRSAFLFTLTNPHGILPAKYTIKSPGENAIVSNSLGPTFGQWDICIYPNSNLNSESFTSFPSTYIDSTGKGYLTFTGSTHFTTTDIEIYQLASIFDRPF